mmetsp:Transcript_14747/g.46487  ORF Transcript_14747/g.46487 Transcript_14747/m.46487 type:complete len:201 (+) Transcript_14747:61-663(+)
MPGEGSSAADANRGCVTMTQRDAEELNQELSKAALRGGDTYIFVPINTPGAMKPAFRSKTPSLVTNSQGGAPSGARSSGGVRRRDSGEPRERKRSGVPGGSAMAAQAHRTPSARLPSRVSPRPQHLAAPPTGRRRRSAGGRRAPLEAAKACGAARRHEPQAQAGAQAAQRAAAPPVRRPVCSARRPAHLPLVLRGAARGR